MNDLRGAIVPVLTPLDGAARIDVGSLVRLVRFVLRGGASGLWLCGTSGEFYALAAHERATIVEQAALAGGGQVPIIAHAGDSASRLALAHARVALDAGADLVSVTLPYYLDWSQQELRAHVRQVSAGIGAPVLLYHHAATSPNLLTDESVLALAEEGVLCGLKESSAPVSACLPLLTARSQRDPRLACFHGAGSTAREALEAGFDGIVSIVSNLAPWQCSQLVAAVAGARHEEAVALQAELEEVDGAIRRALGKRTNWAPTIAAYKFLLAELGVIQRAESFAPLEPLRAHEREQLARHALPVARRLAAPAAAPEGVV
jgi:4-hydroxy-tetrahydrodipicolinate synthase